MIQDVQVLAGLLPPASHQQPQQLITRHPGSLAPCRRHCTAPRPLPSFLGGQRPPRSRHSGV